MKITKSVKSFTKKIAALVSGPRALSEPLHARCCGLRQRDKKGPARDVTQLLCDNKYHNTMFLQKNLAHMFLRAPPPTPTPNWPMSVETLPDTKTIPSVSEPLSKYEHQILDKCLLFSPSGTSPVFVRTCQTTIVPLPPARPGLFRCVSLQDLAPILLCPSAARPDHPRPPRLVPRPLGDYSRLAPSTRVPPQATDKVSGWLRPTKDAVAKRLPIPRLSGNSRTDESKV